MRIGLLGAQGTGKTTLLEALCQEPEFKGYTKCVEVTRWILKLNMPINEGGSDMGQRLIMMKLIENAVLYPDMITDRTIVDCLVYTQWLYNQGNVSQETLDLVKLAFDRVIGMYDRLFYIPVEFDIEDDGVRSSSKQFQQEIEQLFEHNIKDINVIRLSGSVEQRMNQVKEGIK